MGKRGRRRGGPPRDPLADLERVARDLAQTEARAAGLRRRRDELVAGLAAAGVPWPALAAAAGTSRQALQKRHAANG